ncbi:MAG: hypothetical protein M0R17_08630 [Candidatus Omnitrophica bacterium]|jgi:hypothetical protein|nr:hypothetical protein [Candidatus Omnitrophota bacterium]
MSKTHIKIKNTGILYELLVRQMTTELLNENSSKAVVIFKKHFHVNSELNKELQLYKLLTDERVENINEAMMLLDETLIARKKINTLQLKKEKFNLIKEIKETYNIVDFFKTKLSDYKTHASVYKLFEQCNTTPKEIISSKKIILENLILNDSNKEETLTDVMKEFNEQDEGVRLYAYKLLIEKFNEKYKNLNVNQKRVLKEYVNNLSNSQKLIDFIETEKNNIKVALNVFVNKITDNEAVKIKINEITNQLETLLPARVVTEQHMLRLMRIHSLIYELNKLTKQNDYTK